MRGGYVIGGPEHDFWNAEWWGTSDCSARAGTRRRRFTTVTESHGAVMVDLSSTGARFRSQQAPHLDEELMITVECTRAFGRVAWIDGNQFGVEFDDPIGTLDVLKIRGKLMKTAGLAPEMSAAMDDWQTGMAR